MARPATMTALAFIILAALGGLGWLVYERITEGDGEQAPLIRADDGPMKIRPKDPGGMAVPDQDKLIYQTLNGGVAEETAERLLPPPEEPLPPPQPPQPPQPPESVAQPPAAAAPEGQDSALPPLPPAEIGRQAEAPAEGEVRSSEPEAAPAPREPSLAKTLATVPQPPAPKPAAVTAPSATPADAGPYVAGSYMVQLASLRSIDDADKAWRMAVKKNGDLLSAHSARVVRADLGGDQGVFYRLRIGPFAKRQEAKSLCAKLKARNVDCIVVKP